MTCGWMESKMAGYCDVVGQFIGDGINRRLSFIDRCVLSWQQNARHLCRAVDKGDRQTTLQTCRRNRHRQPSSPLDTATEHAFRIHSINPSYRTVRIRPWSFLLSLCVMLGLDVCVNWTMIFYKDTCKCIFCLGAPACLNVFKMFFQANKWLIDWIWKHK